MSTVRQCPQCHSEVSPTARFCAECGSSMTPGVPVTSGNSGSVSGSYSAPLPATTQVNVPMDERSNKIIITVLSSAIVILLISVGFLAWKIRDVSAAKNRPCVSETPIASVSPPPVQQQAVTTPQITQPDVNTTPAAIDNQPPAEVVEYLKFIQGIDQKRITLLAKVPAPATTTTSPPTDSIGTGQQGTTTTATPAPTPTTTQTSGQSDIDMEWSRLIDDFRNPSSPESCRLLTANYLTYLNDCRTEVAKNNGIAPVSSNELTSDALKAEAELVRVCSNTKASRLFTIAYPGTAQDNHQ